MIVIKIARLVLIDNVFIKVQENIVFTYFLHY